MAKTQTASGREVTAAIEMSAKTRKAVDSIRDSFAQFVRNFAALAESRAELAPRFMKAFSLWSHENDGRGTFVDFVRVLDNTVPVARAEYRVHRAYQAADYLRRLVGQASRAMQASAQPGATGADGQPSPGGRVTPVSHVTAIARLLKAVAPLLSPETQPMLWAALQSQLGWSDNQVKRIQSLVQQVDPLVVIREPRNVHAMGMLRLRLPERPETASEAA